MLLYVYVYVCVVCVYCMTRVKKIGNGVSTLSSYQGIDDSQKKIKKGVVLSYAKNGSYFCRGKQ